MIFKVIGQIFRGGDMPRFALPLFIYCIHGEFYLFKGGEFNLVMTVALLYPFATLLARG
jgi:hypothetical protein